MSLESVYGQVLNEHNLHPFHKGETEGATLMLEGKNPTCGDDIFLQLKVSPDGIIEDGSFQGAGCAISQASVDIMLDLVIGETKERAMELCGEFMNMIQGKATQDEIDDLEDDREEKNEQLAIYWCAKEAIFKKMSQYNVDFVEQIEIERFRSKGEGELEATFIHKDGYEEDLELEYITFDRHVLVWVRE